jgi:hypothetical protein
MDCFAYARNAGMPVVREEWVIWARLESRHRDMDYTTAPANLMKHVEFMHKVRRLKRLPTSWRGMFFAEARDLNGN